MSPRILALLVASMCAVSGCARNGNATPAPTPAAAQATGADATAAINGIVVHASAMPTADLNDSVATRYGLARNPDQLLLLVTVRDANGDAAPMDAVKLQARAGVLPDAPAPLALRAIETNGLVDYIGTVPVHAPASVQFEIDATRGGAHSRMSFTRDLLPH